MIIEKRLFVVSNSIHYLNMINYISSKIEGQNYLILLLKNLKDDNILLEKVKENSEVKLITLLYYNINSRFPFQYFNIFSLIRQIKKLKKIPIKFHTIFFNNYDSWIQHYILKQVAANKIVLISDGTGIFDTVKLRKKSRNSFRFSANKVFVNKILRLSPIKHIHFYSPVVMEVAEYDSIEIFNFKASTSTKIKSNNIYFVGSPLIEKGYLLLNAHLKNLSDLRKKFPKHDFYYLAHRAETADNLFQYENFGTLIPYSKPFEERLENAEELPGMIIYYLSSVLINLPQIYPQICFLYFPILPNDIPENSSFKDRYISLVKNFKQIQNSNLKALD